MAGNFAIDTRDYKFILKEWMRKEVEEVIALDAYRDYYSADDVDMIVDQMYKICQEKIAPTNDAGEAHPAHFENGVVTVAPEFKPLFKFLQSNGWGTSNIEKYGEGVLPEIFFAAVQEMMIASNPSFGPYIALTSGAANLIQEFGDDHLKQMFLPKMFNGDWSGTMCLTEPGAGSDVGDILTKAYPTDDPRIFKIKGTKCFITGGDHDLTENIIHLTLARVEGAAPGTKGISLFVVPKMWVNEDGSIAGSNDVVCAGVEHKMGLKGSSTAVLNFGENNECRGWILGNPPGEDGKGEGMAQMFVMMNGARTETGHAGLGTTYSAYASAVQYTKERIQGRLITNPRGPRVAIINHEDIKLMLLNIRAQVDACRAMIFKTYYFLDMRKYGNEEQKRRASRRIEVMTPICKAHLTDIAWQLCGDAIQCYGGYGYMEEYPVAQCARDVKIFAIWEGTNFIQSMDLVGRKWMLDQGRVFQEWLDEIKEFSKAKRTEEFAAEFDNLDRALTSYDELRMAMGGFMAKKMFNMIPLHAHKILTATAHLYLSMLMLDQAVFCSQRLKEVGEDYHDAYYYKGKIASMKYYLHNVTPQVWFIADQIKCGDTSVLEVPLEFF